VSSRGEKKVKDWSYAGLATRGDLEIVSHKPTGSGIFRRSDLGTYTSGPGASSKTEASGFSKWSADDLKNKRIRCLFEKLGKRSLSAW